MTTEPGPPTAPLPENIALLDEVIFNRRIATMFRLAQEQNASIRKLNPNQYPGVTLQINRELFAELIGQPMIVSGWVQQHTKNGGEYVYVEDHKLQCVGCLIMTGETGPEFALGGLGITPNDTMNQYVVPLDILVQFPELMDIDQANAILRLDAPELLDFFNPIQPIDPSNNCVDSARMIMELAKIPLKDIPFDRLSNRDLNRVIKAINTYCKTLVWFDQYMPYDITYKGRALRNNGWTELEATSTVHIHSVGLETVDDPDADNSLAMMVRVTRLGRSDSQNEDFALVAKRIEQIQSGRGRIPRSERASFTKR